MKIREASLNDTCVIAATGATVWICTYATESVTPVMADYVLKEFSEEEVKKRLEDKNMKVWVAEDEGGIVGFVELVLSRRSPEILNTQQSEVTRLYILERFSRNGLGRRLLKTASNHAFTQGTEVAWLSVWAGNKRAIEFYQKAGWTHAGETTFLLGGEAHANHVFALRRSETRV